MRTVPKESTFALILKQNYHLSTISKQCAVMLDIILVDYVSTHAMKVIYNHVVWASKQCAAMLDVILVEHVSMYCNDGNLYPRCMSKINYYCATMYV